jgi:hypothetical protein
VISEPEKAMPLINDKEYDHGDCELQQDSVAYPFESVTYSSPRENKEGHGNSRMPQYQTEGRCTFQGELKVREHVWLQMRKQLIDTYGSVYGAKPTYTISKGVGDDNTIDTMDKCRIMDIQKASNEGIDAAMVTLPLKPWRNLEDGVPPFKEEGQ